MYVFIKEIETFDNNESKCLMGTSHFLWIHYESVMPTSNIHECESS